MIHPTRMPVLFVGHGSPMNGIDNNPFTRTLKRVADAIPRPRAIVMISAHWMTEGTWVTAMARPKTIHDFYGFPEELFAVKYPAPGSPETADLVRAAVTTHSVQLDVEMWGLDHGAWTILRHMYPAADVPVVQLSLYMHRPSEDHFALGRALSKLRDQGILIMGSGNLVHNLRKIKWETHAPAHDWATEFDAWTKQKLVERDFRALTEDIHQTEAGRQSVPSLEHYLPLHYILGAAEPTDELTFEFEEIHNASIGMRTFQFAPRAAGAD